MVTRRPVPVRLDAELIDRLDAISAERSRRGIEAEISRSDTVRLAIERGVAVLESELGLTKKKR